MLEEHLFGETVWNCVGKTKKIPPSLLLWGTMSFKRNKDSHWCFHLQTEPCLNPGGALAPSPCSTLTPPFQAPCSEHGREQTSCGLDRTALPTGPRTAQISSVINGSLQCPSCDRGGTAKRTLPRRSLPMGARGSV